MEFSFHQVCLIFLIYLWLGRKQVLKFRHSKSFFCPRMGLKPTEVAEGYERALEKALEVLETLSCFEVTSTKDAALVEKAIR
jgi:hypothetical protein